MQAILDPPVSWQLGIADLEFVLHFDRALHGFHHARELGQ
jgi:hypothetical protein